MRVKHGSRGTMYLFLYFTYLLKQVFLVVLNEVDFVVFVHRREQMSGPDLHVFTLKFVALKNLVFPHKKYFPEFF